jgi:D-3-phosphoglycerate dehydrogenase
VFIAVFLIIDKTLVRHARDSYISPTHFLTVAQIVTPCRRMNRLDPLGTWAFHPSLTIFLFVQREAPSQPPNLTTPRIHKSQFSMNAGTLHATLHSLDIVNSSQRSQAKRCNHPLSCPMVTERIVCTASIDPAASEMLAVHASVEILPDPSVDSLLKKLTGTTGIVCRGEGKVPAEVIAASTSLKVIGRTGAGVDAVDIDAATARGIAVVFAPVGAFAVAEGALAMLLSMIKMLPQADRWVKAGDWNQRYNVASGDMTEHTLGIVGFGRIGQHLAKLARPFDMRILAFDAMVSAEVMQEHGAEKVGLDQVFEQSDFVSLHVPLTDETRGLIDSARLQKMKRGAILVNTSRGGVVKNLDVLVSALDAGQLSAVALDVFPEEPPDHSHPLFARRDVLCAPHFIGLSTLAWQRICRTTADGMLAVYRGEKPQYCVNPEVFENSGVSE